MQRVLIVLAVVVALTAAIFLSVRYVGQQSGLQTADTSSITGDTGTTGTTTSGPVTATRRRTRTVFRVSQA